jgi:hypothetical protein
MSSEISEKKLLANKMNAKKALVQRRQMAKIEHQ